MKDFSCSLVVLITFLLIMLADKYRYRTPSTYSTDDVRRYPVTIQPLRGPTSLVQTNPGTAGGHRICVVFSAMIAALPTDRK